MSNLRKMCLSPNYVHPADGFFRPTYHECTVPDITQWIDLKGDFSWSGLDNLKIYDNQLDTFKNNKELWSIFSSPTSCWVNSDSQDPDEESFEEKDGHVLFYRDQQDCVLWYYDLESGKVYEYDRVVSDTLEEFWLRIYIESILWYKEDFPEHLKDLIQKYIEFFEDNLNPHQEVMRWIDNLSSSEKDNISMVGDVATFMSPSQLGFGSQADVYKEEFVEEKWEKERGQKSFLTNCGKEGHPNPCYCAFMEFRDKTMKETHFFIGCDACGSANFTGNRWYHEKTDLCDKCYKISILPQTFECITTPWSLNKIKEVYQPNESDSTSS